MKSFFGILLIAVGVLLNNTVYLQDLILGQDYISLDGWRAFVGLGVSLLMILVGCLILLSGRSYR